MKKVVAIFVFFLFLTSCSSLRSFGLGAVSPLFKDAISGIEKEGNWEQFKKSTPANLALLDGLLSIRPSDENLLLAAIKGNAGYAFGVEETLYLEDKLAERENSPHKEQAIYYYTKAIDYGVQFLRDNDLELKDLMAAQKNPMGVSELLRNQLSDDETTLEIMLFMAQSIGSLINMQRDNIRLINQLPLAKGIFDWVCDIEPDIAHGMCPLFFGSYEAGRPAMLGGNPEKGKDIFENYIAKHPENWLGRVFLIQFYIIPQYNKKLYSAQKKEMERFEALYRASLRWKPRAKKVRYFKDPTLKLYQAIAIKRYQIVKKYEKDLF